MIRVNFKKVYLAVAARMAQSRGFQLFPGALSGAATREREGKAVLVVLLQAPPSQPPPNRAGVLIVFNELCHYLGLLVHGQ